MLNNFIVSEKEKGERLDKLLASRFPDYSRHYFQYLIENQHVFVNQVCVKKAFLLKQEDSVQINWIPPSSTFSLKAEPIPLEILYEDDDLLIINKPASMVVHPAVGNWDGTVVNALLSHCKELKRENTLRPGIVHRLDKETSGALIAAKHEKAQEKLIEIFAAQAVYKEYFAICLGRPKSRLIESSIGRHPIRRKEMAILERGGKFASTLLETITSNNTISLVRLLPKTGRTHQLRVHLKSIGSPILGDTVYGRKSTNQKFGVKRQLLHARRLRFIHPIAKKEIEVSAPFPEDIIKFMRQLQ